MRLIAPGLLLTCIATGCYASSPAGTTGDAPPPSCGNGRPEAGEECDEGDDDDCDGCSSACTLETALAVEGREPGASVPLESSPCPSCPFTIEAWFRIDEDGGIAPIFHQAWNHEFNVAADGYSFMTPFGGGGTSWVVGLETGTWHHAAATCFWNEESGGWYTAAFIDGYTPIAVGTMGPSTWTCDEPLLLGYAEDPWPEGRPAATIDDVRISSEAIYNFLDGDFTPERELGVQPDTIAFWDFDNVVGGVIPDISGHGHDAILGAGRIVPDACHLP